MKGGKATTAQSFGEYLFLNLKRFGQDGIMDSAVCSYEAEMDMLKYLDPLHYNPETGYIDMPYKLMGVIVHDLEEDLSKG